MKRIMLRALMVLGYVLFFCMCLGVMLTFVVKYDDRINYETRN